MNAVDGKKEATRVMPDERQSIKLYVMLVPHAQLMPATLRAVIAEFVTRDGTDHSSIERRVEEVLSQLETGCVQLYFDEDTNSCNILPKQGG
jgi:uncharacterized protein YheU (UPF0270 family)